MMLNQQNAITGKLTNFINIFTWVNSLV